MELYQHCKYTSDEVIGIGTNYQVLGLEYNNYKGEAYILPQGEIGTEIQTKEYLDSIATYDDWVFVPGELAILKASENDIQTLELGIDGTGSLINFTQSDCVMLPRLYEVQQAGETTIPQNVQHQVALIEVWTVAVIFGIALAMKIKKTI